MSDFTEGASVKSVMVKVVKQHFVISDVTFISKDYSLIAVPPSLIACESNVN